MALPQAAKLRIKLLSTFALEYEEKPLLAIDSTRLQSLLAYLLIHRHTPLPRQQLAFLFWPDASESQAFTNLRNLLFKLRHALPNADSFLFADGQHVQWRADSHFTLDVADFESAAAHATGEAELAQAIALYSGDLLPSCYEDWIYPLRQHYQQIFISLLGKLIDLYEQRRDYRTAIRYGQRLLQIDPLNEGAVRLLMRLHAMADDRASALRVYHDCQQSLQKELEVEPDAATTELYQRLLHMQKMEPAAEQPQQESWQLVGRHAEWHLLQEAWARVGKGSPQFVLLAGEAGIGKTRLAEELIEWVTRQGFTTATARCYAAEGDLPYAPIVSWLRTESLHRQLAALDPIWIGEISRLLPELLGNYPQIATPPPLTTNWQRQRLFEALAQAVLNAKQALLLFIDDLQWADRDTLEWLHYLLRFASSESSQAKTSMRLLLVGTVRSEEIEANPALSTLLLTLQRQDGLVQVDLTPLLIDETSALATAVTGAPLSPEANEALYRDSEGNPLFIVEMMRTSPENHSFPGSDHVPRTASQPLPPKVHAVIQTRLAKLSPSARELAGVAATIGRAFDLDVLIDASAQEQSTLVQNLDELWHRRIVRERGANRYDFTHDKLREVTYNSLSAAHRRLLHRNVAEAMVSLYASANGNAPKQKLDTVNRQIAAHFEQAGLFEAAVPHYLQAAEDAQRLYANLEAINIYHRVLALLEGPAAGSSSQIAAVCEKLADLLNSISQYEQARLYYLRATGKDAQLDRVDQARLRRKIGNTWREQYDYQQALAAYQSAELQLGQLGNEESAYASHWWQEWLQIQLEVDLIHYWLAEIEESVALQHRIEPLIEAHGSLAQQATFFQRCGQLAFRRSRSVTTDTAMRYVERSLERFTKANMQSSIPSAYFMLGFTRLWHTEPDAAIEPLQMALQHAEANGDLSLQARSLAYLTIAQRRRNDIACTEEFAARTLAVAAMAHMPEYVAMAKGNQAWLAWRKEEYDKVEELGQAALELWHQLPVNHASAPFQWIALLPLIAGALHTEEVEKAIDYTRALLDPHQQKLPESLASLCEQALHAWEQDAQIEALQLLSEATTIAHQLGYL